MDAHFVVNNFMKNIRELILKNNFQTFDKSEFVPTSNDIPNMVKEMLNNSMADCSHVEFKISLAGAVSEVKEYGKKPSFCSDFAQMIKNIVGLIGYEFSRFLIVHIGMFKIIDNIIEDINDKSDTYEDILHRITMIYNLMKSVPKSTYNFIQKVPSASDKIFSDLLRNDGITPFFDDMFKQINDLIATKNIIQFDNRKEEIIGSIRTFIDSIKEVVLTIEGPCDLIIMNMGEYTLLYDGSFIKLFEILYKSLYADNHRFNDKSITSIVQFNLVETTIDDHLGLSDKTANYYIKYMEEYFNHIYRITYDGLITDTRLTSYLNKVQLLMTNTVITAMAKITLGMFARLVQLINLNRISLLLTSAPSRIQFFQVLQAFLALPPGIDFTYTEQQMFMICYILTSDAMARSTKNTRTHKQGRKKSTNKE